jgi:hypothetical protein
MGEHQQLIVAADGRGQVEHTPDHLELRSERFGSLPQVDSFRRSAVTHAEHLVAAQGHGEIELVARDGLARDNRRLGAVPAPAVRDGNERYPHRLVFVKNARRV